jgi:cobalt-zinc-cadmium efflux system outer membrane protein
VTRALVVLAVVLLPSSAAAQARLTPAAVLGAVERWLPPLARAVQDLRIAEADVVGSQGAFDLNLKADGSLDRGYYDNETGRVMAERAFPLLGASAFGGYRLGRGVYAPYDQKAQTLSNGELAAGLTVPLLRDRATDARRTELRIATDGVRLADASLARVRLSAYRDALARYWDAVAAAEQWRVQVALLRLAEERTRQLSEAVALGQIATVERTDNERAVRQRRAAVVAARRTFEQQAIDLSLSLRDAAGAPRMVTADELVLPADDAAAAPDETASLEAAVRRRPELRALDARRAQLSASEALARNTLLPQLNLFSEAARDLGTGPESRIGSSWKAGVTFSLPLQRRRATGQSLRAAAALTGLDLERRFAADRIHAEVRDALSAWRAADDAVALVRDELVLARELEALERDRFQLGDSTQFLVNLRELTTADAALREVRAVVDRHKARLALSAATALLLDHPLE